jgi:predicted Zn-dependent peptidase
MRNLIATFALSSLLATAASAQSLADLEKRTTVHRLANGWTFILVERPGAPVFSFATLVNVGSAQEGRGTSGLAHMFEHMAFKGTPNIGTRDWPAEREALAKEAAAYEAWQAERLSARPDLGRLTDLERAFREAQTLAVSYVIQNEFPDLIEREGGNHLNANTGVDATRYFYSLPANKLELFCYLESERFLHPVLREFYRERDVVMEERRMAVDNNPIGRLVEQMLGVAFLAHPYGVNTVGHMSDLQTFTVADAERFYRTYYVPNNLVTAVVGQIRAAELIPLLEKYFGRIPAGPPPPPVTTVEPPQGAEKTVVLRDRAQPLYLEAYHRPAVTHRDNAVYDAIDDILSKGRTSRLYRRLVRDEKVAIESGSFSGMPGVRYPHLWAVYAFPAGGQDNDAVQASIRAELERLRTEDVSEAELTRFKTRAKAEVLRALDGNLGLALALVENHRLFGDWRELWKGLERVEAVTAADIRRVANETLRDGNRTVAKIETLRPPQPNAPAGR